MRTNLLLITLALAAPAWAQTPFAFALDPDSSVHRAISKSFVRIGPDMYRLSGAAGNNDSVWVFIADINANGVVMNMNTTRCFYSEYPAAPSHMIRTSDQGMLFGFHMQPLNDPSLGLMKVNVNSEVEWFKFYADVPGQMLEATDIALIEKDGHYFSIGEDHTGEDGSGATMMEFDNSGACVVRRTWAMGDTVGERGAGIARTASNGLLTATIQYYGNVDTWLWISVQQWNANVDLEWSKGFSFGRWNKFVRPLATRDGGSLITGLVRRTLTNESYGFFLRLDSTGAVLWARQVLTDGLRPTCAVEDIDGGFAVVMHRENTYQPIVARLDSTGALITAQRTTGLPWMLPHSIERDSITGEYLVQAKEYFGSESLYLFRLDQDLNFSCGGIPYTWADSLITPLDSDIVITVITDQLPSSDTTTMTVSSTLSVVDACLSTATSNLPGPAPSVWPLPAIDLVNVALGQRVAPRVSYTLLDGVGRSIEQGSSEALSDGSISVPVGHLSSGTYLLRLEVAGMVQVVKVVK